MIDPNNRNLLEGLRYLCWVRCSTLGQADTSIEDQINFIQAFAQSAGMVWVDDVILDGVSGQSPKVMAMVDQIVQRKREHNDFDVVLVHDLSRLTRRGVTDGGKIEWEFRNAGIELISVADGVQDGEHAEIMRSFKHFASEKQSIDISRSTTRGSMTALQRGKRPHAQTAPYGTDKLVLGPDDKPRFILHLLPDGHQQKLAYPGRELIETYGRKPCGASAHYRLQHGENFDFIPGEPAEIDTINNIYNWKFREGINAHSIAKRLNDQEILSPRGNLWHANTIEKMLSNPTYLGGGYSNTMTTGRFFKRGRNGPLPTHRTAQELAMNQPPRRYRPEEDWERRELVHLTEFIRDKEVRAMAARYHEEARERQLGKRPKRIKSTKPKHQSKFFLTDRLTCAKTGLKLRGYAPSKGKSYRYYGVGKGRAYPKSEAIAPTQLLPAAPVELLVLTQLRKVLLHAPALRQEIRSKAHGLFTEQAPIDLDVQKLEAERKQLDQQMSLLVDMMPSMGREAADAKAKELSTKRKAIERQLQAAAPKATPTPADLDRAVDHIIQTLTDSEDWVRQHRMLAVKQLLDLLLARCEVDLETRLVQIEFRLPKWALESPERICLTTTRDYTGWREADSQDSILLRRGLILIGPDSAHGVMKAG